MIRPTGALISTLLAVAVAPAPAQGPPGSIRFATFNASLNRSAPGELLRALDTPDDPQIRNVAEIIRRARPDVLPVDEFDFDDRGPQAPASVVAPSLAGYLRKGQGGAGGIDHPYRFAARANTGLATGVVLDNDGVPGRPGPTARESTTPRAVKPGASRLPAARAGEGTASARKPTRDRDLTGPRARAGSGREDGRRQGSVYPPGHLPAAAHPSSCRDRL